MFVFMCRLTKAEQSIQDTHTHTNGQMISTVRRFHNAMPATLHFKKKTWTSTTGTRRSLEVQLMFDL